MEVFIFLEGRAVATVFLFEIIQCERTDICREGKWNLVWTGELQTHVSDDLDGR